MKYMSRQFFTVSLLSIFAGVLFFVPNAGSAGSELYEVNPVHVYVFYSTGCPHCRAEIAFLEEIEKVLSHVDIIKLKESENFQNQNIYINVIRHYKLKGAVPTVIIGDQPIVGFDNEYGTGQKLLSRISMCTVNSCDSWVDGIFGKENPSKMEKIKVEKKVLNALDIHEKNPSQPIIADDTRRSDSNTVRAFGREIHLSGDSSIYMLGIVLGLADGINPCMFAVLLFLLTYLLAIGSRKRALKAGIAFSLTTFVVYFLFMFGIVKVVDILNIARWLRITAIWFSLIIGVIMIKDFFVYGKWISLEIPKRLRPMLHNLIERGTLPSAIVLALFAGIVELPCTSGLPLAYVATLASRELNPFWYLALYNLFFVLPLFSIIFFVSSARISVDQIEQKRARFKKYMRLAAGVLLIFLAIALWRNWL
ncbi:MAG: hypothetical protein U9M90_04940 [Patescibacteria group bacterium]|nr:hypothetical protein [Patescibacteria group bacterium]